jgi:hypothetical protein
MLIQGGLSFVRPPSFMERSSFRSTAQAVFAAVHQEQLDLSLNLSDTCKTLMADAVIGRQLH